MSESTEPTMKTVELHELVGAEIQVVDFGLPATNRCDCCGAQAYVEIEMYDKEHNSKYILEMCNHHYTQHEPMLVIQATRIIDHRPFLQVQERAYKGQPATS